MRNFLDALAAIHSTVWLSTVGSFSIAGLLKALASGFLVSVLFSLISRKDDESLAQNVPLFSAFMDNLPAFAWIKDLEGRYVYVNKLTLARLPAFPGDWLGKTDADLWPGEIGATYRANDLKVIASRETLETVETCLLEGERHCFLVSKFPIFDHTGAAVMVGAIAADISAPQRANDALREAEKQYRDIFENAVEGIFQTTPDGHFITANPALARMLGYDSTEELLSCRTDIAQQHYVDPALRLEFKQMLEEDGVVRDFEHRAYRKDGRKIWLSENVRSVCDANGVVLYYEGFTEDITARKRSEESLGLFRNLIDQSNDAIEVLDPSTLRFLDCNTTAHQTLGYTREEFLALTAFDIDPIIDEPTLARLGEAMDKSAFAIFESVHRRKDGSTFPVEINVKTIRLERDYRLAVVRDITERKRAEKALQESEERFRQLSEAAFEAIILHDQGTILEVNQSFCGMYGYERAEVIGNSVLDLALPEFRELLLQRMRSGDTGPYEGPALRKDGTTFKAEVAGKPIHYQGRTVRVAAIRDITEQKRNERRQAAQYAVTRVLAESATLTDAIPKLLRVICESLRWKMGEFWRVCDSTNLLRCVETWHVPALEATSFIEASRQTELAPEIGLPGLVWQSGQPVWIPDLMTDARFARAAIAAKVGLRCAVAFPVLLGNHTLGVMLFFSNRTPEVDEDLLKIMSAIGSQIGQFTERKRAEEALLASERKYRDIFTFAPVGIYQSSRDGTIITANHTLAEMLGYASVDELLRVKLGRDVYLVEDERERLIREHEVRGYPVDLELQWKTKDGSPIWVQLSAHAIKGANGATEYWEGFVRDVTERKLIEKALRESEERYRDLVENSHELICTHDLDGKILSANRAATRLLGYDPHEFIGKGNIRDILAPEVRHQFDEYMARVCKDGATSGIMLVQTSSGEHRVWEYYNSLRTEGVKAPIVRGIARDVTEQRRAEKVVSDLRHELELTMNSMEEGIHRVDLKGNIVFENPAAARMLGWEVAELLGKPAHLTMHHTRQDGMPYPKEECPIYATLRDGVSRHGADEVFWRQDGMSFPVEYMTAPMRNDRNEIVATVVTFRDITERTRADEKLQNSEKYFRSLIENASDLITVADGNGIIRYESPSLERMLGYKPEERMGKSVFELLHPDDLAFAKRHFAKGIQNPGIVHFMECRFQHKDGSWHLVETTGINLLDDPVVAGIVVNSRDITERKRAEEALRESEERYRELFENAKDTIYVHDLNGIYTSVNRAAEQLTGYSREEIIGKHFSDFLAPEYLPRVRNHLAKKLTDQRPTSFEVEVIARDGRRVPVELSSNLVCEDGVPVGVQGIARDITERKRAAELLQTFPRRLIEAQEEERKRIARELHDEIGQVLTAISLNLQAVRASGLTPTSTPKIDESILVVDDALHHVQNLALELRPSLLDDLGLAAAIRWFVDRYAQRTGIKVEVTMDVQIADGRLSRELETACFRIVQEALTNVARHAEAQTVSIHLRALSNEIRISIKDDGVGFDAAAGNGAAPFRLGLRGMEERALALGGKLEIKSARARGTEILAYFPNENKKD